MKSQHGNITITKENTNGDKVAGATFKITASEDIYNVAKTVKKYSKGDTVATITTGTDGTATETGLPLGSYTITETSVPTGYLLDTESQKVTLSYKDQTTAVVYASATISNKEPTGEIKLEKTDIDTGNNDRIDGTSHHGDANLSGTVYTLYASEDVYNTAKTVKYFSKDEEIATFTFDSYGVATINITNTSTKANLSVSGNTLKGLPLGTYYAKETTVSEGYTQDTAIHTYTLSYKDMNTSVVSISDTLKNTVQKAKFEVIKISSNTNSIAKVVEGAEFTAILTKYVDFYGSFDEALKHLDEFAEDEYSVFTTGSDGHGISGYLAYGEYTVNETYTPENVNTVEEFYVTINQNSDGVIKELVANDTPFEAYLKMIKVDKDTGKTVTLSNATFSLYKLNENSNEWEQVSCKIGRETFTTWTTDDEGVAYTETKLSAGTYKIEEVVIPDGYLELDEDLIFEVGTSNKTLEYDEDYDAYITVTVANEQPTGTLNLAKLINLRENVDYSLINNIDFTQISFRLVANENIIDYADGSVIYEEGQEIGTYNLDTEGKLTIDSLPMGVYYIQEVSTISGAVLDNTKYDVIFEKTDNITKVYAVDLEIANETTFVELSKTSITGDEELEGATLQVLDSEGNIIDEWVSTTESHKIEGLEVGKTYIMHEEVAIDGYVKATDITFTVENTSEVQKVTMIDKIVTLTKENIGGNEIEGAKLTVTDKDGNIVDSWTSTNESHNINGLVEGETYTLHEEYAPDGYVIATDTQFTVSYDKETQEIVLIDKQVTITKENIAGEEVEGAELKVVDKDGNIIDSWTSTNEAHIVNGLIEGETYTLYEDYAPDGYVISNAMEFTVTTDKETQEITMIDKIVLISKTDLVTGEELPGAELQIIDEEGNVVDEWTSTDTPYQVIGLEEGKTYTLVEITCPYGYEIAESITFTVSYDKETQLVEMKDMPILVNIQINKVDETTGEAIKSNKFVFGIYADEECTELIQEVEANKEEGIAVFEDLRYGTYYIKELQAPTNYILSDKIVKIEINDEGVFADGEALEEMDGTYSFEFKNTPEPVIQTGDETNYLGWLILAILSLIGIVGGVVLLIKKHK